MDLNNGIVTLEDDVRFARQRALMKSEPIA